MNKIKKALKRVVVLGLKDISVPQLMVNTKHYLQKMRGNAAFASLTAELRVIAAQLAKLETSYAVSQSRQRGTVDQMHTERKTLEVLLKGLGGLVEVIANSDPENALNIIESAGMVARKLPNTVPKQFSVKAGKEPGSVILNTKAMKRGTYIYEMTTDPNNPSGWEQIIVDVTVRHSWSGLSSGVRYYFRVAVVAAHVKCVWSPVLNILIQ